MKTDIDSYSDVLILTIKNGNIILVPFFSEKGNQTKISSKNEYDYFYNCDNNESKSEDINTNFFDENDIKNERKDNETFKFKSKLSYNWKNNIKNFKSKQFNKYNKSKKHHN